MIGRFLQFFIPAVTVTISLGISFYLLIAGWGVIAGFVDREDHPFTSAFLMIIWASIILAAWLAIFMTVVSGELL